MSSLSVSAQSWAAQPEPRLGRRRGRRTCSGLEDGGWGMEPQSHGEGTVWSHAARRLV